MTDFNMECPIPVSDYPNVLLAHGSGGKLMHQLLDKIFLAAFTNPYLKTQHDGATISVTGTKFAFTTDSYVVHPIFFPGGDIGSMAVYGTVNDLAMCGAEPKYISAGFIIEEGFSMNDLWRVVQSMKAAAQKTGVQIVTGDTKIVDKGKGDGIFINTAGIGAVEHSLNICPQSVKTDDAVILSGDIGRHGMAIMAVREGLKFESQIESDSAPLHHMVLKLIRSGINVHCLRDLTRGGLSSGLVEIARSAKAKIEIDESKISIREDVKGACEILGLDPFYVANEGRFIAFIDSKDCERAKSILKSDLLGNDAEIIGKVEGTDSQGLVTVRNSIGTHRILDMLSGEQLPRIC